MQSLSVSDARPTRRTLQALGARLLEPVIRKIDAGLVEGRIDAILPDGSARILGGRAPGPVAIVHLVHWLGLLRLMQSGSIGWFEAWQKGEWTSPDLVPLFDLTMRNRTTMGQTARAAAISRVLGRVRQWLNRNSRAGSKRNIHAHYDLGNDFYGTWLDESMTYSSAVFATEARETEALETAQTRKVDQLLSRLTLKPQSDVLEIGCGWGFLSRKLAEAGHFVTGLTLSVEQKAYAEEKAKALSPLPRYALTDYRDAEGQFDAIVSVEMVEAVGEAYWPNFLDAIEGLLKPGGRAALQYIAIADDIFDDYARGQDFIQAYIFPGGMLLSERKFRALAEARGLRWMDQRHFCLDYAETLKRWRQKFDQAAREGQLPAGFDDRFIQLWRYYLMYCEGGFRGGGIQVGQVTLVKEGM